MFADAPKFILTSQLQPCTTEAKSKHEEVEDQLLPVRLSVGVTDPVPAKPQVSHDVRNAISPRICSQVHVRCHPYSAPVCAATGKVGR